MTCGHSFTRLNDARPEFASIRNQALAHIDRSEFDAARAALASGRDAARALRGNVSRNEAEFLADEAGIDHLNLAYRAAAEKYAEAANVVGSFDRDAHWQYLLKQPGALYDHGDEFGDNEALLEAIDLYHSALIFAPRERVPARLGADPEQSRHRAQDAGGAGERDGAARGGGCRL